MKVLIPRVPRLVFYLAVLGIGGSESWAQNPANLLSPPRTNLVAVHWPDLTMLEAGVREQLASLQTALANAARDRKTTDAALSEAYGTMGKNFQAYSLNSAARECYLNASRLAPRNFRWIYLLGYVEQQGDRVDEAIRQYRLARALRPDYLALPVNLGNIYLQLNRLEEANENFNAALAIDGNCVPALYGLGQVALSQRNYADAVKYFEKALALIPGANRIHYSLAMAHRGLGNNGKAKDHLARQGTVGVRVRDPVVDELRELIKGERIYLARGKLAVESRRYAEAIEEFRKALAANPESVTAHVNLGSALVQTGNLKEAAEHFEAALRLDPKNINAHFNLAVLSAREEKHQEAVAHLQFLVSVDPNDLSARLFLARELVKSNRIDDALAEYSRAVEADPNNEEALLEQVKLLIKVGEHKQALNNLKRGHERYPQKGRPALLLAYLLATSPQYDLRDGSKALELAQLIYKATGYPEHGAVVAFALAELGRCAEAAAWQRKMIAAAEQQRKADVGAQLKSNLKLYEVGPPCRPAGETVGQTNPD
jgi:tetratricopeptide (TPR) repeat protein